jgi:uncharacterized protein YjbI with pentapeptide repeats
MADEQRKRIPRPLLWGLLALAGAVLLGVFVFVIVVAPSLLIRPPKTGLSEADLLKARNDARTTLVQALAGLAVAGGLLVTYRTYQQNRKEQESAHQQHEQEQDRIRQEQDRTYHQHQQEQDRIRQEQDRTYERELYAKAVEQLGHEKAPVRLGALYSLERLAEDKPERRQIIVDVICAYLRMPFAPAGPAIKPEPEAAEAPEVPAAQTERRTDGTGDTWRQERQVRLTAQHILAEHLRDDRPRDKRSTDSPSSLFWPDIRLNLAGATLIDFNLVSGVTADANFGGATFTGDAGFDGATFSGGAIFGGATFSGDAGFDGAIFSGSPRFDGATFTGDAMFGGATFTGSAWFRRAIFTGDAMFEGAAFMFREAFRPGSAWFDGAAFTGLARFGGATFSGDAGFSGAAFGGSARFDGEVFGGKAAAFGGKANFDMATFTGDAIFSGVMFSSGARFDKATFSGEARFSGVTFSSSYWFDGATFSGTASFRGAAFPGERWDSSAFARSIVTQPDYVHSWPTGWRLGPDGSGGYTVVRADDGLDTGLKPEVPPAAGTAGGA